MVAFGLRERQILDSFAKLVCGYIIVADRRCNPEHSTHWKDNGMKSIAWKNMSLKALERLATDLLDNDLRPALARPAAYNIKEVEALLQSARSRKLTGRVKRRNVVNACKKLRATDTLTKHELHLARHRAVNGWPEFTVN